ncbi:hypothetical protein [Ferrimicrobium acidiphilum]|nr:hypothetical protein [Ferrimicrobium acidiphilum]
MDWIQRIESDYQSEGHTIHLVDEALSLAAVHYNWIVAVSRSS